jgi:hypothetical protein
VIADFVVQLALQVISYGALWAGDFRTWTTIGTIISFLVIFTIQWTEHSRLRNPNGVVLFYWLFLLIALAVKLRSLISQQIFATDLPYFVTYCVGVGLSVGAYLFEWWWPDRKDGYEALVEDDECPLEKATVFSRLTFSWLTPLMRTGYSQYLTEDDLWALAREDHTSHTGRLFEQAWEYEVKHHKKPSLWRALFRAYGVFYSYAAIFKVGNDISQYMQPQLLRILIAFAGSYGIGRQPDPIIKGAAIALAMFATAIFQTAMAVSIHAPCGSPLLSY